MNPAVLHILCYQCFTISTAFCGPGNELMAITIGVTLLCTTMYMCTAS